MLNQVMYLLFIKRKMSFALPNMTSRCYLRPVKWSIAWNIPTTSPKI